MAITLTHDESTVIDLETYVEFIRKEVNLQDEDSILGSAPALGQLANNRTFLAGMLNQELKDYQTYQQHNAYSAQSIMLFREPRFSVRAVVWENGFLPDVQEFAYDLPHDHNFDFLTVGYTGPGYGTEIYEYDNSLVTGLPGERVDLRFLEDTTLPAGKIMFYRKGRDVHRQKIPAEFSVSLNLMIAVPPDQMKSQYLFDLKNSTIVRPFITAEAGRLQLLRMTGILGDGNSVDILADLADKHFCPWTRLEALHALRRIDGDNQGEWDAIAAADPQEIVRRGIRL